MNRPIKDFLLSSNYWVINKLILKELGLDASFLLSAMAEADNLLADDDDGWFYQTIEKLEEITTLTRHKQSQAIKLLIEKQLLEQQNRGVPMKRYFRINYEELTSLVAKNSTLQLSPKNEVKDR